MYLTYLLSFFKSRFVFLFLFAQLMIYLVLHTVYKTELANFLEDETTSLGSKISLVQKQQERYSTIYFHEVINRPAVLRLMASVKDASLKEQSLIRKKLFDALQSSYLRMKKLDIRQLHFHLPNADSFLRMHKPEKFGDNLSDIRFTVVEANKKRSFISGFEEGRIFNGFRYIYPLSFEHRHLGTVEISASFSGLNKLLTENFGGKTQFLIKKSLVEEKVWEDEKSFYKSTILHSDYVVERGYEENKLQKFVSEKLSEKMQTPINKKEAFSLSTFFEGSAYIISLFPVANAQGNHKAAAYVIGYKKYDFIDTLIDDLILAAIIFTALNVLFSYLMYSIYRSKQHEMVQNKIMASQTRMAKMGELLSLISHQWKQPLSSLSAHIANMEVKYAFDKLDAESFDHIKLEMKTIIKHLSETMETFKNFYNPNKKKELLNLSDLIKSAVALIKPKIEGLQVEMRYHLDTSVEYEVYRNEMTQVIMVLCQNSLDAFADNKIVDAYINIALYREKEHIVIEVIDNGGGINNSDVLNRNDPYMSTKESGTGLGLFMVDNIITENHQGTFVMHNVHRGLKTRIVI